MLIIVIILCQFVSGKPTYAKKNNYVQCIIECLPRPGCWVDSWFPCWTRGTRWSSGRCHVPTRCPRWGCRKSPTMTFPSHHTTLRGRLPNIEAPWCRLHSKHIDIPFDGPSEMTFGLRNCQKLCNIIMRVILASQKIFCVSLAMQRLKWCAIPHLSEHQTSFKALVTFVKFGVFLVKCETVRGWKTTSSMK